MKQIAGLFNFEPRRGHEQQQRRVSGAAALIVVIPAVAAPAPAPAPAATPRRMDLPPSGDHRGRGAHPGGRTRAFAAASAG